MIPRLALPRDGTSKIIRHGSSFIKDYYDVVCSSPGSSRLGWLSEIQLAPSASKVSSCSGPDMIKLYYKYKLKLRILKEK